jgi:hypothetical protein
VKEFIAVVLLAQFAGIWTTLMRLSDNQYPVKTEYKHGSDVALLVFSLIMFAWGVNTLI